MDFHLIQVAVFECGSGEFKLPISCAFDAFQTESLVLLPFVEVADEIDVRSVWGPLAEYPFCALAVQTEVEVAIGKP